MCSNFCRVLSMIFWPLMFPFGLLIVILGIVGEMLRAVLWLFSIGYCCFFNNGRFCKPACLTHRHTNCSQRHQVSCKTGIKLSKVIFHSFPNLKLHFQIKGCAACWYGFSLETHIVDKCNDCCESCCDDCCSDEACLESFLCSCPLVFFFAFVCPPVSAFCSLFVIFLPNFLSFFNCNIFHRKRG